MNHYAHAAALDWFFRARVREWHWLTGSARARMGL
jgi:hypothetical protein